MGAGQNGIRSTVLLVSATVKVNIFLNIGPVLRHPNPTWTMILASCFHHCRYDKLILESHVNADADVIDKLPQRSEFCHLQVWFSMRWTFLAAQFQS